MPHPDLLGRILAYPVYLFYWVVGLSLLTGMGTIILSYANADPPEHFSNVLQAILSDPYARWVYEHRYLIVFVSLFFIALSVYLKLRYEKQKWTPILGNLSELNERFSDLEDYIKGQRAPASPRLKEHLSSELIRIANIICNIMGVYTSSECHVAIKALSKNGDVETVARSQTGSTRRRDIDDHLKTFNYKDNTAFFSIIDRKAPCFCSNWLLFRRITGRYKNRHKKWWKDYRATIVVPISTERNPSTYNVDNTFGFVCVDNKTGGFDSRLSILLLGNTSARCVDVMVRLSRLQQGDQ